MTDAQESSHARDGSDTVEMPMATIWPFVLSVGVMLLLGGAATNLAFSVVGAILMAVGLAGWIGQMLPGQGHAHESMVEPALRPQSATGLPGTVGHLRPGMAGYRFRVPEKIHPISAGVKGGILGGLVMPIPAIAWSLASGHGLWFPANLLAGMLLPNVGNMSIEDLEAFHFGILFVAIIIHVVISVVMGLIYGVLMPTLPEIRREIAWGGVLMPMLWTGVGYPLMGGVNPILKEGVSWPLFIGSQILFGVVAAITVLRLRNLPPIAAGIVGGLVGGAVMALPASLWGLATGNGIWYPINLLAGMIVPGLDNATVEQLRQFNQTWFVAAAAVHGVTCAVLGAVYGLLLPRLPPVPAQLPWGAVLMPLAWTGASYSVMGIVNPLLQEKVNWPWFVVSQFVFGAVAAVVVVRSEQVYIPPVGGPARPDVVPAGPG